MNILKIKFGTSNEITDDHFIVGSSQNRLFLFIVHKSFSTGRGKTGKIDAPIENELNIIRT